MRNTDEVSEPNPLVQRVDALLRRHQQRVEQSHALPQPVADAFALPAQAKALADTSWALADTSWAPADAPIAQVDASVARADTSFTPEKAYDAEAPAATQEGASLAVTPDGMAFQEAQAGEALATAGDVARAPDDDVPVLTDIVDPDALAALPEIAEELRSDALIMQIETAVMQKLMAELDRALDQRLGRTITDLLEQVLHGLRAELSVSVRQMVREAVAAATAKEIAERLRSE